ncbi:unannotated protein [freshwater metagenome]|uniref:Unannotated protein n=1 Tax=freshwater metagenome TaxID=449393 RepID=A0A6J7U8P2_9ZZZZ
MNSFSLSVAALIALVLFNVARAPSHVPREAISLAAAVTVPRFNDVPISSAIIERIRRSLRLSESSTAASKERARPSQFKNDPLFSVIAATGKITSARCVTSLGAISRDTTNALSSAANAAAPLMPSSGSTPPTSNAPMSPEFTAL